ncbi:MAG: hypothetical protein NW217_17275 [Hyphomicrobiaceae bacterium]|nr:hypothetical protein [Hyphomicrobiaceae bacterium]
MVSHACVHARLAGGGRSHTAVFLVVMALALSLFGTARGADEVALLSRLQVYEAEAYRDYEFRSTNPRVLDRSDELWKLHTELAATGETPECAAALRILSMMVQATYYSSRNSEIPMDWFTMAPQYEQHRTECLTRLDVDADAFRLPSAFLR